MDDGLAAATAYYLESNSDLCMELARSIDFMSYCRDLKFEEKPDYNHLRRIFKDLFNSKGYEFDYVYDWNLLGKKNERARRRANAAASNFNPLSVLGIVGTSIVFSTAVPEAPQPPSALASINLLFFCSKVSLISFLRLA